MQVKCPNCGTPAEYSNNKYRPFCSERCKLIDFGAWAEGEYSLSVESSSLSEEDLEQLEAIFTEQTEEI